MFALLASGVELVIDAMTPYRGDGTAAHSLLEMPDHMRLGSWD